MRKILFLLALTTIPLFLYAQQIPQQSLDKALELYKNEKYADAVREYEILISNGFINADIYYNLSNAYYKSGEPGKASLNIERALRLFPRDKNIRYNRDLMAELAGEPKLNIAESAVKEIELLVSLNELTVLVSVLFVFLTITFGLYCLGWKKILLKISIFLSCLFVLAVFVLFLKVHDEIIMQEAVVLYPMQVRNKPVKKEDVAFEVLAGRKVFILTELGRWANVKLSVNGLSGWMEKNYIEKI